MFSLLLTFDSGFNVFYDEFVIVSFDLLFIAFYQDPTVFL